MSALSPESILHKIGGICLVLVLIGISSCRPQMENQNDVIPATELPSVISRADAGDIRSIRRLIHHFETSQDNDTLAEKWRAKARKWGDSEELYHYASRLTAKARADTTLYDRRRDLMQALQSATQSYSRHPDVWTQALINEINLALISEYRPNISDKQSPKTE